MEELQLTLTPQRVDQRNFGIMLTNWRVGQQLNALVVATRPDSSVLLSVGGKQFVATTDIPVQQGSTLRLEVKQAGPEVVLKQVDQGQAQQAAPRTDAAGRAADNAIALSSARPSALLNQLAAQPARFGSPDLQELARELLGRSLKADSLKPGDLRKALQSSGLFTEVDLASGQTRRAQQSSKATLSQLQALALALADEQSEEAVEGMVLRQIADKAGGLLNGIAQNQLASLPVDDNAARWVFTLPLQLQNHFHDVRTVIERERRGPQGEEEEVWRASLSLDLPRLGAVDIRVQMVRGAVSVNFSCENSTSSRVLNGAMSNLEQRLMLREINVDHLAAEVTARSDVQSEDPNPSHGGLSVDA